MRRADAIDRDTITCSYSVPLYVSRAMMKTLLYLLFVPLAVASMNPSAPREESASAHNARRTAELIRMADKAVILGELEPETASIAVADRAWMERLATTLSTTSFADAGACLCIGWKTVYFYKNGKQIFSLAAIHDHQLRAFSTIGGGDFVVDEQHWKLISDLIHEKIPAAPPAAPAPKNPTGPSSPSS